MHGLAGAIDGFEPLDKVEQRCIRQGGVQLLHSSLIMVARACFALMPCGCSSGVLRCQGFACQSPLFPTEGSQGPVPKLLRIALAGFGRLNDPRRHDLIDDARLSGVVKVFAGRIECLTHDLGCMVVKNPGEASLFDKSYDRGHIENLP
jgi:hypothetical protein